MAPSNEDILKRGIQPVHEAFANYMLINPGCTLREMGAVFGYSQGWISRVINTDMFRAYMAQRQVEVNSFVAADLPSKLSAAAHIATERMIEVLEKTEDPDLILESFDKVLHRYGYAPNAKNGAQVQVNNTQNNVFYLNKGDLDEARGRLIEAHQPKDEPQLLPQPEAPPEPT